jgi:succinate dehydrogenase/fumarate reductase flavoprotein subunit
VRLPPAALHRIASVSLNLQGTSIEVPVLDARVAVIGSGAAGLNAAVHLVEAGMDPASIVVITDEWGGGTSYNSGSDKQTYYKLSISGEGTDSPLVMARDLFNGGSMHGDIALTEAAGSIEEFFHLIRLGVDFPRNEHGIYPGYQTDNDTRQRATSVGPYTSREMVEAHAREAARLGIGLLDGHVATRILVDGANGEKRVVGVACLEIAGDKNAQSTITSIRDLPLTIVRATAVVLATGGPANIYASSVYPVNQRCAHGLGIEVGATMQNLSFMQYGIASSKFRWNLSGSFQQVIPAYWVEGDAPGVRAELLHEWLPSIGDIAYQTFLKGYNWPFNPAKCDLAAPNHSSIVDLAVHDAVVRRGKRLFMDFRVNPWDIMKKQFSLADLPAEAKRYLGASNATQAKPIERLAALNPFAINVYKDHGIDLWTEPVEIRVATQHCNGGFTGDINWESPNVRGLFPVGEANGSHGQHRPGGAALNAGQVGGLRIARYLARGESLPDPAGVAIIERAAREQLVPLLARFHVSGKGGATKLLHMQDARAELTCRMAVAGGIVRSADGLLKARDAAKNLVARFEDDVVLETRDALREYLAVRDAAITHHAILAAMVVQFISEPDVHPCYLVALQDSESLHKILTRQCDKHPVSETRPNQILETRVDGLQIAHAWVHARPVPDTEDRFEAALKQWKEA